MKKILKGWIDTVEKTIENDNYSKIGFKRTMSGSGFMKWYVNTNYCDSSKALGNELAVIKCDALPK